ncbi:MAG: hypothetical protein IJX91_02540 [Clostridia bacterium]|nr:hypothetical protein [Clostridia bacterium]
MSKLLYIALGVLAFVELYAIGAAAAARKCGEKDWKKCFIPFYAFYVINRMTGGFTVLSIPVRKMHGMLIALTAVILAACAYTFWGQKNLPELSAGPLKQIMTVIVVFCAFLAYVTLVLSAKKIYRRFNVKREGAFTLLSLLVVTIPVLFCYVSKNEPKTLKEMY